MSLLGKKVKDRVTGFTGIVIAESEFLYGCTRIGVQEQSMKDGKVPDPQWFDEPQVIVLDQEPVVKRSDNDSGGPMPYEPKQNETPKR